MSRRLTIALIVLAAAVGSLVYLWLSFPSGILGTMDYRVLDSQLDTPLGWRASPRLLPGGEKPWWWS